MMVEEQNVRNFYMEEAIKGNWSVRQLERQIATCSYSRVIANNSELEKIDNVDETTALNNNIILAKALSSYKNRYILTGISFFNNFYKSFH